jgi:chromosome segregation ATPase
VKEGKVMTSVQEKRNLLDLFEETVVKETEKEFEAIQKRWGEEQQYMDLTRQRLDECRLAFKEENKTIRRAFRKLADIAESIRRVDIILEMEREDIQKYQQQFRNSHSLRHFYQRQIIDKEENIQKWEEKRSSHLKRWNDLYKKVEDFGFHDAWIETLLVCEKENYSRVMKQILHQAKIEVFGADIEDIDLEDDRWDLVQEKIEQAKEAYFEED